MVEEEKRRKVRIHVGGLSKDLVRDIADLETRFGKVGKIVDSFEVHEKPVLEYHFAYITMQISKSEYIKLKKLWDGVRFKGSKLTIAKAKEDYKSAWEKDSRRQDKKILQRKQRQHLADERLERIANKNMNPFQAALVVKGRMRKTPRKTDLKNLTIRVKINGRLKVIKCKKNKLWGVDKNKNIKDFTYRFVAGEWRDGNDHVIERFTGKVLVFDNNGVHVDDEPIEKTEVDEEINEEHNKTNQLLNQMLSKYDFSKPIEINEDEDDNKDSKDDKGFDYELQHIENEKSDDEMEIEYNVPETNCLHPSRQSIIEEYQKHAKVVTFDDEEDDDEFYKNIKPQNTNEEEASDELKQINDISVTDDVQEAPQDNEIIIDEPQQELENNDQTGGDEEAEEEEFIPTFGSFNTNDADASKNTTEKLRDLLSSTTPTKLSLLDDEKMEEEEEEDTNVILPVRKTKNIGLFFSHFNSPFLIAQAQINKFREVRVNEELEYDDWFWKNRGELNREFRRLRRDVLRRTKKKSKSDALI